MALPRSPRNPERGAALALTLIAITALLGLGALTVLGMRTELLSSGQSRFNQAALYAAESGAAAGVDFLRTNCKTVSFFSEWIMPRNENPQSPDAIVGNNKRPGQDGNPFLAELDTWYSVKVYNNVSDKDYNIGKDSDGTVILHSTGYGPDQTVATIELEVKNDVCTGEFCATSYAQRGLDAYNDSYSACSSQVQSTSMRQLTP